MTHLFIFYSMSDSKFQSLLIMSTSFCKRPLSDFTKMFKLLKKTFFFQILGDVLFLANLAAKFWSKKNHPPLPVVAIVIMPNIIVNETSVSTLFQNIKLNPNFAAVSKISKTLETC